MHSQKTTDQKKLKETIRTLIKKFSLKIKL